MKRDPIKRSYPEGGCGRYTSGVAHVDVHFPLDRVYCANCVPFCVYEEPFRRYTCAATGEQLLTPFVTVGDLCPIQFIHNDQVENNDDEIKEEEFPWH